MSVPRDGSVTIEGRVARATPGRFTVTFRNAAGDMLAIAVRGPDAHGVGRRVRRAAHAYRMTCPDGSLVRIEIGGALSRVRRGDGTAVGTLLHTATVTAVAATGGTLFHVVPDSGAARPGRSRWVIVDRMGDEIGLLEACTEDVASGRLDRILLRDRRLPAAEPSDRGERDLLLSACVDLADDPRCYGAAAT